MNQIDKNTVSSEKQLKENEYVSFLRPEGCGKRVLFVGNSITRHGIAPQIGWNRDCGMAASSAEHDYVHIVMQDFLSKDPQSTFCICQASLWERGYKDPDLSLKMYEPAQKFQADFIIFRIIENCSTSTFAKDLFKKEYMQLIDYLSAQNDRSKIILTSGFWKHPGDSVIREVANERGYPFVYLGNLGEDDSMKAVGLFEHSGVAIHPGDLGMQMIAKLILNAVKEMQSE